MNLHNLEVPNASRWEAGLQVALILALCLVAGGLGWLFLRLLP